MAQQNVADFKTLLDTNITNQSSRLNTWDKVKALFENLADSQYNILDFVNLGPGNPIDAGANTAFVALLKDDGNWDNAGVFSETIPAAIKEGDYIVETGTDGTEWVYKHIGGNMYRFLSKVLNAFLEGTLPDIANIDAGDWTITGNVATAPLTGIAQGNLWLDQANGLLFMSFKDGEISRFDFANAGAAMSAASIMAAINSEIGTGWQTGSPVSLAGWESGVIGAGSLSSFYPHADFNGGKLSGQGEAIPFSVAADIALTVEKRPVTGDFDFSARIDSMIDPVAGNTVQDLWAMVLFIAGDAANAPFMSMAYRQEGAGNYLGRRSVRLIGGSVVGQNDEGGTSGVFAGGKYVRLSRTANSMSAYISDDGNNWTQVGPTLTNANLGLDGYIGLAVSDGGNANGCEAEFSQIKLT
ncbi:MAG: hypothetical protein AAF927_01625 [Bacteroidota bacterium]